MAGESVWDYPMAHLEPTGRRSLCEWKGQARYLD